MFDLNDRIVCIFAEWGEDEDGRGHACPLEKHRIYTVVSVWPDGTRLGAGWITEAPLIGVGVICPVLVDLGCSIVDVWPPERFRKVTEWQQKVLRYETITIRTQEIVKV